MKASRLFQWRWLGVPLLLLVAACDQQPLEVEVDVEELAVAPQFSSHATGVGAPIFLSGDDADDAGHCGGTACGGLYPTALKFVYDNSTGGTGIAVIGANGSYARSSFISWNSPANGGPGAPVTYVSNISTVDFTSFRMIYIASVSAQTSGA